MREKELDEAIMDTAWTVDPSSVHGMHGPHRSVNEL